MVNSDDLFVNEDISKAENRVNLALFSLMQQDWFRKWILKRLCLPGDAVVYPPTNVHSRRPDLKVVRDGSEVAMIEVELGTNPDQAEDYRQQFDSVKTIWGKRKSRSDLSLEEVAEFLEEPRCLSPQTKIHVQHLCKLIKEGLSEYSSSGERGNVSEEMLEHRLVQALCDRLGDRLKATTKRVRIGQLKADTIGKEGFSPKVNRRDRTGEVALFSISGGAHLIFPSRQKLNRCLPKHRAEVDAYMSLITTMGCDVDVRGENALPHLSLDPNLDAVLGKVDELAPLLRGPSRLARLRVPLQDRPPEGSASMAGVAWKILAFLCPNESRCATSQGTKLKPRWNLHLWGPEDRVGAAAKLIQYN